MGSHLFYRQYFNLSHAARQLNLKDKSKSDDLNIDPDLLLHMAANDRLILCINAKGLSYKFITYDQEGEEQQFEEVIFYNTLGSPLLLIVSSRIISLVEQFGSAEVQTFAAVYDEDFSEIGATPAVKINKMITLTKEHLLVPLQELERLKEGKPLKTITQSAPHPRAEKTYLNTIGALINLMLGNSPSGTKHSVFNSQASIIDALISHNENKDGIAKRTLEGVFKRAKDSISKS